MKLIEYSKISPSIFKKYHFQFKTYLKECKECADAYLLVDGNNFVEIYEYKDDVEVYFDRCINKNINNQIEFLEDKFKNKNICIYVSVKNKCLKTILNNLSKKDYGCPKIVMKTRNKNMFKTPKLVLKQNCKHEHDNKKLVDQIEKNFNTKEDFCFPKKDLERLKKLLDLNFESGGSISKIDDKNYKLKEDTIIEGKDDNIDMDPTTYNFHTHPKSVYTDEDGHNFAAWFSGVDIRYIVGNIPFGLKEHFLITNEGIYRLRATKQFSTAFKKLSTKNQEKIIRKLYNMFADLEMKRIIKEKKNRMRINSTNIKHFNDFFVTTNSVNSSMFPKLFKQDFVFFDLDFKFWKDFKC